MPWSDISSSEYTRFGYSQADPATERERGAAVSDGNHRQIRPEREREGLRRQGDYPRPERDAGS
jgi:hypothetical protein